MKRFERLIKSFSGRKVVVVGDLVADEFVFGRTSRLSREAPVPIVRYERSVYMLGGAANAAHNIVAMGGKVVPVGVVGQDEPGRQVISLLKAVGADTSLIAQDRDRRTVTKTRILAGDVGTGTQQMLRLDRGEFGDIHGRLRKSVIESFRKAIACAQCVIFSDYGEGVLCDHVREELLGMTARSGIVTTADSRYKVHAYKGVWAVIPNLPELIQFARRDLPSAEDVEKAAASLQRKTGSKGVLVKRGSGGMGLYRRGRPMVFLPPHGASEVVDVTGAGDTVIASFSLALCCGADMADAAWLANMAGGIKVTKRGTATVSSAELLRDLGKVVVPQARG